MTTLKFGGLWDPNGTTRGNLVTLDSFKQEQIVLERSARLILDPWRGN